MRSQAIKEQLDSIRKTEEGRKNTARAISEGLALSPRAGRESDLYSKYRKIVSEYPVQMIPGNDRLRARDKESVVRAIRRVIKLEQDSGKPLSEKEIMKKIGEFSREEYGKIVEAEKKGDFLGRFRLGG